MRIMYGILGFAMLLSLPPASADEPASRRPSAEQIVERLAPPPSGGKTRGYRGLQVEGATEAPAAPPSLDLEVNFEFASARLSNDAKIVLDNLGQALKNPSLAQASVRVVGHTDAKGSDAYNLTLSQERAAAVARYLSSEHGIAGQRLTTEGKGRSELFDRDDPYSALNRRVQIIRIAN